MALKVSQGSGATLATDVINGEHLQRISAVSIYPLPAGTNFIGLVSLASINGTVAISGIPAVSQSGTWNVGITGLTSLASGTLVGLNPGTSQIGSVTISNTPAVTQSGTWTVQPGNTPNSTPWLVTQSGGLISLASGTEIRSLATILNFPATQTVALNHLTSLASGTLVGLNPGTSQIGSVTISNTPAVTQSGTWNVGVNGLLSLASGTEVRVRPISNITLNSSDAHIGSVSIFGNINTTVGMITLFPGPNQIGSVTISNIPAVSQSGTWNVGITGLTSLASGTLVGLNPGTNNIGDVDVLTLPAIPAGTNQIGSVTISNVPAVTQSGAWTVGITGLTSLASGTEVRVRPISNITLNPSDAHIGSVSIFGTISTTPGMTTLFPGPNQIGSVTISNTPAVTQSGTWTVGLSHLVSLASGQFVSLNAGTNHIGSVSIFGSVTANTGMTTLFPGPNQIGSVTISNIPAVTQSGTWTVGLSHLVSLASGTLVGLNPGTNNIGDVDVLTLPATPAGANYIGLVTIIPTYLSTYTNFATVAGISGSATLFTPPNGQKWILKDLIIGALGSLEVGISSSSNFVIPYMGLATTGGYVSNFGDSGIQAKANDQAFVINTKSTATLAISANVRFEA